MLAKNLPKASNFYINYFILNGAAVASQRIFNIAAVSIYIVLGKVLDNTPRKMYNRYTKVTGLQWGSLYPKFTNLAVIAISYSCIAPLTLAFATIGFYFLSLAFRYTVIFSSDTTVIDTQGRAYVKALSQLTTGIYLAEICLIGLFAIASGSTATASGPLALEVALLVVTSVYHIALDRAVSHLAQNSECDDPTNNLADINHTEEPETNERSLLTATGHRASHANASWFFRMLRAPTTPHFAEHLQSPGPAYSEATRRKAYLHPAITSQPPQIWIVHDEVGVSRREKNMAPEDVTVTDKAAWWDESGNLTTSWTGQEERGEENNEREAPIWQPKIYY